MILTVNSFQAVVSGLKEPNRTMVPESLGWLVMQFLLGHP